MQVTCLASFTCQCKRGRWNGFNRWKATLTERELWTDAIVKPLNAITKVDQRQTLSGPWPKLNISSLVPNKWVTQLEDRKKENDADLDTILQEVKVSELSMWLYLTFCGNDVDISQQLMDCHEMWFRQFLLRILLTLVILPTFLLAPS